MKKTVRQDYQDVSELLNGKDVPISEVKTTYEDLCEQEEVFTEEIIEAIECNDYVRLSHLLTTREQLRTAIETIESLYGEDLFTQPTMKNRMGNLLHRSADITASKGEDVLGKVTNSLEKANQSTHHLANKTLDVSTTTISRGNQLNHKTGKFLINQTANAISRLGNMMKKKS
ncbi:hypothetical protein [Salibacterium aidingense]|uniref:hypothetical protein n=1 Tax=Salibacterium aidingense TaxID=384933 RepID=UPI00047E8286|nr:hypothetical protein [Salibacterium aidingense]